MDDGIATTKTDKNIGRNVALYDGRNSRPQANFASKMEIPVIGIPQEK